MTVFCSAQPHRPESQGLYFCQSSASFRGSSRMRVLTVSIIVKVRVKLRGAALGMLRVGQVHTGPPRAPHRAGNGKTHSSGAGRSFRWRGGRRDFGRLRCCGDGLDRRRGRSGYGLAARKVRATCRNSAASGQALASATRMRVAVSTTRAATLISRRRRVAHSVISHRSLHHFASLQLGGPFCTSIHRYGQLDHYRLKPS